MTNIVGIQYTAFSTKIKFYFEILAAITVKKWTQLDEFYMKIRSAVIFITWNVKDASLKRSVSFQHSGSL